MEKLEVSAGMVNLTLNCGSGNCPCVACGTASLQNCGQLLCRAGAQISREGHRFLCVRYRAGLEQPLIRCTKRLVSASCVEIRYLPWRRTDTCPYCGSREARRVNRVYWQVPAFGAVRSKVCRSTSALPWKSSSRSRGPHPRAAKLVACSSSCRGRAAAPP